MQKELEEMSARVCLTRLKSSRDCFGLGITWTPKVCKIMAFMAIIRGLGLFFYIFLGLGRV